MPQMMPINWIISFIMFILIFILFNIMNYYIYNFNFYKINKKMKTFSPINYLHWKW